MARDEGTITRGSFTSVQYVEKPSLEGLKKNLLELRQELLRLQDDVKNLNLGQSSIGASEIKGFHLDSGVMGDGLSLSADVVSVNVDDSTIEMAAGILQVKNAGITPEKLSINPSRVVWADTPQTGYSATNVAASVAFADRTCGLTPTAGATMSAVILKLTVQVTAGTGPVDGSTCHLNVRKNGYVGGVYPALHFSYYDSYRTAIVTVGTDAAKVYERGFTWAGSVGAKYTLKIEELGHIEEY